MKEKNNFISMQTKKKTPPTKKKQKQKTTTTANKTYPQPKPILLSAINVDLRL